MGKLRLREFGNLVEVKQPELAPLECGRAVTPGFTCFFHWFTPSWYLTWLLSGELGVVSPLWASDSSFVR